MVTDLELLEVEIETLWATDHRGRILLDDKSRGSRGRKAPHLVIAVSNDGQIAAMGSEVTDELAVELQTAVASRTASGDPGTPPACMAPCEQLLRDSFGRIAHSASPAYVIPPGTAFQSAARIVPSDGESEALRGQDPKAANWSPDEWRLLLDGAFGPWAVATVGKQIISICYCARLTDRGAEAGVWTDPEFRGQGHAAAVTAAWASLLAPSGRCLFYSTSASNVSSQRVAARLGLRLIGWRWQLSDPIPVDLPTP